MQGGPHWGGWGRGAWGPHHFYRMQRGPSRLLWFFIGGLAATWWIRRKDMKRLEEAGFFDRHRGNFCGARAAAIAAAAGQGPSQGQAVEQVPAQYPSAAHAQVHGGQGPSGGQIQGAPQQQQQPEVPAAPWGWDSSSGWRWQANWGTPPAEEDWDQEKAKLKQLAGQATDAMADMSEATLDSVLSTVETLKSKLAEHRAQRDRQRSLIEEQARQLEEQKRLNPPRWV